MQPSKRKSKTTLPKVVVVLGPNASGKSELAVKLARQFNGEVISADSRQVYRGLNIGSGKVPGRWIIKDGRKRFIYKGTPHYLIDVASPRRTFTVEQYRKLAGGVFQDIRRRGRLPIIVGGTGLYIDALIYNMDFPKVPPQPRLRKALEKKTTEALFKELKVLDPKRADKIDLHNRRRLIRALEIIQTTGLPVPQAKRKSPYQVLKIGIRLPEAELKRRIEARLNQRIKEGMVEEVKKLRRKLSWGRLDSLGLEYRYIAEHLQGKTDLAGLKNVLKKEIYRFAKRQLTWFRKDKQIHWISTQKEAENLVQQFLK